MASLKYYIRLLFNLTPRLAYSLAGSSVFRVAGLTTALWYFLLTRKTFLRNVPKTFSFVYNSRQFSLPLQSAIDVAVLTEVFVLKEYEWQLPFQVKNILDLGAHWGDSAVYYSLVYPEATVYAVEPTPAEFKRLMRISEEFSITPINGALGASSGIATLFVSSSSLGNSFLRRSATDTEVSIPTFTLQTLCTQAGVEKFDLIKFDIEGAESIIFSDERAKSLADAFIGEIHLDLIDVSLDDIKSYFSGFTVDLSRINQSRYVLKALRQ